MFMNTLHTRSAVKFTGGLAAAGLIGLAVAPAAFADEPVPVPAPVPGAAAALPGAGNQMGNAFLQALSSMLGRVVPGADQMIPSTLPDPGAAPVTPGQPVPGAPAPAPADPGQTVT